MSGFTRVCQTKDIFADSDPAKDVEPSSKVPLPSLYISYTMPKQLGSNTPLTTW